MLRYGLAGAAAAACGGVLLRQFLAERFGPDLAGAADAELPEAFRKTWGPAEVFKGGGPDEKTWQAWQKAGWVKEAYHYRKLGGNVQCKLCPNDCVLSSGDRGRCRNRVNRDGVLYTMAYANPCCIHVDPIEKKPLFHYLPGAAALSLATSGCGFRCLNCQNWEISQSQPEDLKDARGEAPAVSAYKFLHPEFITGPDMRRLTLTPEAVAEAASACKIPTIAYTYSEPFAYYEYLYDCCRAARKAGVRNVAVTCGYINRDALVDLTQYLDAASVNLKSFSEDIYSRLNSGHLDPILDTLKVLKARGVWFEVINLIVPTYTDKLDMIARMCDWLVKNLGPDYPLHFSRFHPAHKLRQLSATPVEVLLQARQTALSAGLRFVYLGNVATAGETADVANTFCPSCKKPIIVRDYYRITTMDVAKGKCKHCHTPIAGVWA